MVRFERLVFNAWRNNWPRYFSTKLSHDGGNVARTIDSKSIEQLERLSLVNFGSEKSVARLEAAITFAKQLHRINISDDIQPMYTVLENEKLYLRDDRVTDGGYAKKVLKNAVLTEEDYFVAPPGNVPVNLTNDKY